MDGTTRRNAISRNGLPEGVEQEDILWLEDGQRLELDGRTVDCIAAPGHTTGSMAFLLDQQYLFTGDAFQVKEGGMGVHPYTMDDKRAGESLEGLVAAMEEVDLVFTAHYGCYRPSQLSLLD